ncbi:transcription factor MYB105-like protein [Tanacetum coccineum]
MVPPSFAPIVQKGVLDDLHNQISSTSLAPKPNSQKGGVSRRRLKGHWKPSEDIKLREFVALHGPKNWNLISEQLPGRSGKSCRLRWVNQLDPRIKNCAFSKEENDILMAAHVVYGNQWSKIARFLPGRTDNRIKNQWHVKNDVTRLCAHVSGDSINGSSTITFPGILTEDSSFSCMNTPISPSVVVSAGRPNVIVPRSPPQFIDFLGGSLCVLCFVNRYEMVEVSRAVNAKVNAGDDQSNILSDGVASSIDGDRNRYIPLVTEVTGLGARSTPNMLNSSTCGGIIGSDVTTGGSNSTSTFSNTFSTSTGMFSFTGSDVFGSSNFEANAFVSIEDTGNTTVDKGFLEKISAGFYGDVISGLNPVDLNTSPKAIKSLMEKFSAGMIILNTTKAASIQTKSVLYAGAEGGARSPTAWHPIKQKARFEPKASGNTSKNGAHNVATTFKDGPKNALSLSKKQPFIVVDIPSSSNIITAKNGGTKVPTSSSNIPTLNPYDLLSQEFDPENYRRNGVKPNLVQDDMKSETALVDSLAAQRYMISSSFGLGAFFRILKKGSDFSADLDRNLFKLASFPLRLCTSFSILRDCSRMTVSALSGHAFIPCMLTTWPKNTPSSTPKVNLLGFSFITLLDLYGRQSSPRLPLPSVCDDSLFGSLVRSSTGASATILHYVGTALLLCNVTTSSCTGNLSIPCAVNGTAWIFLRPGRPMIPLYGEGDRTIMKFIMMDALVCFVAFISVELTELVFVLVLYGARHRRIGDVVPESGYPHAFRGSIDVHALSIKAFHECLCGLSFLFLDVVYFDRALDVFLLL